MQVKTTNRKVQNRVFGSTFSDRMKAYFYFHAQALLSSLGRQMLSPFTTIMTTLVLSIAISLAGGFYILVVNAQHLTGNLQATNQISLFLKHQINDEQGMRLAKKIESMEGIRAIKLITKRQAMEEFKTYSGFGEAINALEFNPLPVVIQVFPQENISNPVEIERLLLKFKKTPEVDFAQVDMQWVQRLQSIMELANRGVFLLSFLLGFAVLFITGNTIRLELQNRREEVVIAKMVGATNGFIRKPFLYSGFWYGFFAGVIAWMIVSSMMLILSTPVEKLSSLYSGNYEAVFLSLSESLILVVISSILGMIGSWIVLSFQLNQLKPE